MKSVFLLLFSLSMLSAFSQSKEEKIAVPDPKKKIQIVDVACGECKFGLAGESCDMAVRINGKSYFVDGTKIDSYGDAHAKEGFCNSIRKAEVQGDIIDDRFRVTYFKLLPSKTKKDSKTKMGRT